MTSHASSATRKRPRVGEARKTRQPLKIDKLPQSWREQIQKLRAQGRTWSEIEEWSKEFKWDTLLPPVRQLFPGDKIPETNLIRWYDLRVEQVNREIQARSEQARVLAQTFAGADLTKTDEAVVNALRDTIFAEMQKAGSASREDLIEALTELGFLLTEIKKNEIRERKVKVDELAAELAKRKTDAALRKFEEASAEAKRKLDKGKPVTADDIDRIRERVFGLGPVASKAS